MDCIHFSIFYLLLMSEHTTKFSRLVILQFRCMALFHFIFYSKMDRSWSIKGINDSSVLKDVQTQSLLLLDGIANHIQNTHLNYHPKNCSA